MKADPQIEEVREEILTQIRKDIEGFLKAHVISDILYEACVEAFRKAGIKAGSILRYDMKTGRKTLKIVGCDSFADLGYVIEDMLTKTITEKDPEATIRAYDFVKDYCIYEDTEICKKH